MLPKILAIEVEWNREIHNDPELKVLVNHMPGLEAFEFIRNEAGLYWGVFGDVVKYMFHSDPPEEPQRGFGGRVFTLQMLDGNYVKLVGPWSSRAGLVNLDFPITVDVSITDDPVAMMRGYTLFSGAVLLESVNWWMLKQRKREFNWRMVRKVDGGEPIWVPRPITGGLKLGE